MELISEFTGVFAVNVCSQVLYAAYTLPSRVGMETLHIPDERVFAAIKWSVDDEFMAY